MNKRHADWYFDFISPFSWMQWLQLDRLRPHLSIRPIPIAFGAVLAHCGHKGPAEIPAKRRFSYRFIVWQAQRAGIPLRFPPAHPFNPLHALRLAVALDARDDVVDAIFREIWEHGRAVDSPAALTAVAARFGIGDVAATIGAQSVKDRLRANTDAAISRGVFGVPTVAVDQELFWGNDATPMLEHWLTDPAAFESETYRGIDLLPVAVQRSA